MRVIAFLFAFTISTNLIFSEGGSYPEFYVVGQKAYLHDSISAFCIDASTKELVWKITPKLAENFPEEFAQYNFAGVNRIFLYSDFLYINTCDQRLIRAHKLTGEIIDEPVFKNLILTYPIIEGDIAYFGGNEFSLFAYSLTSNEYVWKYLIGANSTNSLLLGKYLYFGAEDRNFYALDKKYGTMQWVQNLISKPNTKPVASKNRIYAGGVDGTLYCIDPDNGGIYWRTKNPPHWGEELNPLLAGDNIIIKYDSLAVMAISIKRLEAVGEWFGENIEGKSLLLADSLLLFFGGSKLFKGNAFTFESYNALELGTDELSVPVIENNYYYFLSHNKLFRVNLTSNSNGQIYDYSDNSIIDSKLFAPDDDQLKSVFANLTFSDEARAIGANGKVIVRCLLAPEGNIVYKYVFKSEHELLAKLCLEALDKTKVLPVKSKGGKRAKWLEIPFLFRFK